jgi:hypothetical protein
LKCLSVCGHFPPATGEVQIDPACAREPFLSDTRDYGRLIVHGHTPQTDGIPDFRGNRLNLDTGAVFGRPLTAAVFTSAQRDPLGYLQALSRSAARLGSQAIREGPPFLGSFTILIASFLGNLGVVPGFERLLVYIASVGHAFIEIVTYFFCCSVFTTCCRIARHAQRISLVS